MVPPISLPPPGAVTLPPPGAVTARVYRLGAMVVGVEYMVLMYRTGRWQPSERMLDAPGVYSAGT
jgi:hypothetical protein